MLSEGGDLAWDPMSFESSRSPAPLILGSLVPSPVGTMYKHLCAGSLTPRLYLYWDTLLPSPRNSTDLPVLGSNHIRQFQYTSVFLTHLVRGNV